MTLPEIERLFAQGRYLEVRLATEQAAQMDDHQREKQLYALTLSKSGAAGTAEKFFRKVYEVAPQNPENAGIMGGILKELFRYTREQHYAVEARKIYLDNFNVTANYYTGINAAAMHAVTGSMGAARDIARNLISGLQPSTTDFWEIVTLAEAKLLLKQTAEAIELYNAGRKLAGQDWGKVNSVFKQLWLLNHYFTVPRIIIKAFSPPNVAAFVGHMIDKVGARTRFPESIASEIKIQIQERIQLLNIQIGYCSLACGGDILFAEALTESLGDVNIILPFPKEDFLETSVRFAGESWVQRFEALEKKWP
ncbi:MAG TPA: TRAFs-binding domain-containing protein, partial [Cyclobacteriaceae bacterium]|nr:TRAFs-binding domain-containing protein [Cyclobacteriaceae bacterium]